MSIGLVIGFIVLGAIFYWLFKNKLHSKQNPDMSVFSPSVYLDHNQKGVTPKGVKVFSYGKVSAETMAEIDRGMEEKFKIAKEDYGYTEGLDYSKYYVSVWPKSQKCEGAGFLVEAKKVVVVGSEGGSGYDQGESDKDPRPGFLSLCVAGEFRRFFDGNTEASPMHYALAVVDDPAMTATAVGYELEHALTFQNDMGLYEATRDHSKGGGHPILPGKYAPRSLVSKSFSCGCNGEESK